MASAENRTLSIVARLTDHVTKPAGAMGKALTGFGRGAATVFGGVHKAVFNLRTAVVGLAGAYVGLAGVAKVRALAESADELLRLAESTGDTVENLSELRGAFELNGGKAQQFAEILKQLGAQTKSAFSGNAEMIRSFRAIGLTLDEIRKLSPAQLFEQIAKGLERFGTQQERALALSRLLPEQYLRLLPLLGKGSDAFRDAVIQAREAGATVTDAEAQAAKSLEQSIERLQLSLGKTGRQVVETFGPEVVVLLDGLTRAIGNNREQILEVARAISGAFVTAIELGVDAVIKFVALIESIPGVNLLDTAKIDQQIRQVEAQFREAKQRLDAERIDNPYIPDSEDVRRLRAELARLHGIRSRGLAALLLDEKNQLKKQLREVSEGVGADASPRSPQQTANALGVPGPDDIAAMGAAMQKAFALANPAELAKELGGRGGDSVFTVPQIDMGPSVASFDDLAASTRRLIQEVAQVTPGLEDVRDKLLEIEREQAVLELKAAAEAGVLNAEQLEAALAGVERKFDDLRRKGEQQQRTFEGGFKRSIEQVRLAAQDFGETVGSAVGDVAVSGVEGLGDAFGEIIAGTKSAKDAFKDFARQFLIDIAKMTGKLLALGIVKSVFGLEDGGVVIGGVNTNVPFRALAGGDVIRSPTLALIGEGKKNEAVVPLPDNRSIPVQFVGGGGGGGTTLNFNITAMDGKDVQRVLVEQQSTIRSIWENQAETRQGMRQVIQRTA